MTTEPTTEQIEAAAKALLHRRGFCYAIEPDEYGNDAYEITIEAVEDAKAALLAAFQVRPPTDRDAVIEECAITALEQRCVRGTPWDLACVTIASNIRSLKS